MLLAAKVGGCGFRGSEVLAWYPGSAHCVPHVDAGADAGGAESLAGMTTHKRIDRISPFGFPLVQFWWSLLESHW